MLIAFIVALLVIVALALGVALDGKNPEFKAKHKK